MGFIEKIIKKEDLIWNRLNKDIPVVFFGCGNNAHIVKKLLEEKGIQPTVFCDNNQDLQGKFMDGVEVLSYQQVREHYKTYYMILTVAINNVPSIMEQMKRAGEKNEIIHMEKAFKVDNEFLEYGDLKNKIKLFESIYEMLEDDLSKEIYIQNINFRLSGNKIELEKYVDGDTFFDDKLIPKAEKHSYVDVGAYTGDTLLRFYGYCGGIYSKIYAIEPDKGNFSGLEAFVKFGRLENVQLFNLGGWDYKDELTFYTIANENSENFDSTNFLKNMNETMSNRFNINPKEFVEKKIMVDTVDNMLNGAACSLIKINALAADFQVLKGSRKTIQQYQPIIVGEYGTRRENLTNMLVFIKNINPSYKIYLREKKIFRDYKTVFFAIDCGEDRR